MPTPEELQQMQERLKEINDRNPDKVPLMVAPDKEAKLAQQREMLKKQMELLKQWDDKPDFILKKGKILRATEDSAAFDLFYAGSEPFVIGDKAVAIPTGVFTEFKPGFVCIIKEKSGLALKGLEVHGGVIDADYRDEWKAICRFSGKGTFVLNPGDKVAQFMIVSLPRPRLSAEEGAVIELSNQARQGGFGSTDAKAGQ